MRQEISKDESLLGQVFWLLLFIGWVPYMASYAFVLDPGRAVNDGLVETLTATITLYEQVPWGHPAIGILTVAALLSALVLTKLRWWPLLPVPVFLVVSTQIHLFNEAGLGGPLDMAVHALYAGFAIWCSYLFLRHGHLLSLSFQGYVALLLFDLLFFRLSGLWREEPLSLLGAVFAGYQPNLTNILLFVAIAVMIRMLWLMVRDNRPFYKSLPKGAFRAALGKSLALWFPMFLIFAVAGMSWWAVANLWLKPRVLAEVEARTETVSSELFNWFIEYGEPMSPQTRQEYFDDWDVEIPSATDPLEAALIALNIRQIRFSELKYEKAIRDAAAAGRTIEDFPQNLKVAMESGFPESDLPLLDPPGWCFFLDPVCNTERSLKNAANDMMRNTRSDLIGAAHSAATQPAEGAVDSINARESAALIRLEAAANNSVSTSIKAISGAFRTWRNIALLSGLYSAIILLKTLIIVFSRVIFAPRETAAQFLPEPPTDPVGLHRHGQVFSIPRDHSEAFYVSRWGVTLEGPPPARRRPLGFRFPVARILAFRWSMNRIEGNRDLDADEFDAELKVDEPAEIVTWTLKGGERVVFRFPDFIGMSVGIRVRRITSLGITTLVLGRMIFYAAEGPGTLILRTNAAARVSPEETAERPAPMPKLVAWGSGSRFAIHAALTRIDTFFSGYNLRVSKGDGVVWDSSTKRGDGPGSGIVRFVSSFLLPI